MGRLTAALSLAEQAVRERDQATAVLEAVSAERDRAVHERVLLARELGVVGGELAAGERARDAARQQVAELTETLERVRGELDGVRAAAAQERAMATPAPPVIPAPAVIAAQQVPAEPDPVAQSTNADANADADLGVDAEEQRAQEEAEALLDQARAAIARLDESSGPSFGGSS